MGPLLGSGQTTHRPGVKNQRNVSEAMEGVGYRLGDRQARRWMWAGQPPSGAMAGLLDVQSASPEADHLPILGALHPSSPSGMMEIYFPRNLLAMVISCQRLQPCLENTWWAADGGWWLTWDQTSCM